MRALAPIPLPKGEARSGADNPVSPGEKSRPPGKDPSVARGTGLDEGTAVETVLDALDWASLESDLDAFGCAVAPALLPPETCKRVAAMYGDDRPFRSKVAMARHGFGRGEYKYFADPLPDPILSLRRSLYRRLAPVADRWNEAMGVAVRYPAGHEAYRTRCHAAGQTRPTPLLLRYGSGDYNCLHQDVYGEHLFPLQVAILLSAPGRDFAGGEFVLTEQRPRMQSRAEVVSLGHGDGVIFAVRERPVRGRAEATAWPCAMGSAGSAAATASPSASSSTTRRELVMGRGLGRRGRRPRPPRSPSPATIVKDWWRRRSGAIGCEPGTDRALVGRSGVGMAIPNPKAVQWLPLGSIGFGQR